MRDLQVIENLSPFQIGDPVNGLGIYKVAEEQPELILKEALEPGLGLAAFQARKLAFALDLPAKLVPAAVTIRSNTIRSGKYSLTRTLL